MSFVDSVIAWASTDISNLRLRRLPLKNTRVVALKVSTSGVPEFQGVIPSFGGVEIGKRICFPNGRLTTEIQSFETIGSSRSHNIVCLILTRSTSKYALYVCDDSVFHCNETDVFLTKRQMCSSQVMSALSGQRVAVFKKVEGGFPLFKGVMYPFVGVEKNKLFMYLNKKSQTVVKDWVVMKDSTQFLTCVVTLVDNSQYILYGY